MLNVKETNVLGDLINTTWGKSSIVGSPSTSIVCKLMGEGLMEVTYTTFVNFAEQHWIEMQKDRLNSESNDAISLHVGNVKKGFKDLAGRPLTVKEIESHPSVELTYYNVHSPLKRAYYRRRTIFEIG